MSKYRYHWISPYTICEKICFWREIDYDERWVQVVNKILEPVMTGLNKILDIVHPRIEYVKIDKYDTWSMDYTLAKIILPMLKNIQKHKCGAPATDDKDVPKHLRSTSAPPKQNSWDSDDFWFARWNWIVGEMIFAFEHIVDENWENEFYTGQIDHKTEPSEFDSNGKPIMYKLVYGPNHTYKWDKKGWMKVEKRIQNGLVLFGKYYRGLWS